MEPQIQAVETTWQAESLKRNVLDEAIHRLIIMRGVIGGLGFRPQPAWKNYHIKSEELDLLIEFRDRLMAPLLTSNLSLKEAEDVAREELEAEDKIFQAGFKIFKLGDNLAKRAREYNAIEEEQNKAEGRYRANRFAAQKVISNDVLGTQEQGDAHLAERMVEEDPVNGPPVDAKGQEVGQDLRSSDAGAEQHGSIDSITETAKKDLLNESPVNEEGQEAEDAVLTGLAWEVVISNKVPGIKKQGTSSEGPRVDAKGQEVVKDLNSSDNSTEQRGNAHPVKETANDDIPSQSPVDEDDQDKAEGCEVVDDSISTDVFGTQEEGDAHPTEEFAKKHYLNGPPVDAKGQELIQDLSSSASAEQHNKETVKDHHLNGLLVDEAQVEDVSTSDVSELRKLGDAYPSDKAVGEVRPNGPLVDEDSQDKALIKGFLEEWDPKRFAAFIASEESDTSEFLPEGLILDGLMDIRRNINWNNEGEFRGRSRARDQDAAELAAMDDY
ncbi:hypothetical protein FB451DRAFT_1367676 [Mycena latifolia]|nr:hypothetical protein FB451DRAFT_1367676 [Mycena latifolia]